jgi:hypothetical protein
MRNLSNKELSHIAGGQDKVMTAAENLYQSVEPVSMGLGLMTGAAIQTITQGQGYAALFNATLGLGLIGYQYLSEQAYSLYEFHYRAAIDTAIE